MKKSRKRSNPYGLSPEKLERIEALLREFDRKYNEEPSTPKTGSQPIQKTEAV